MSDIGDAYLRLPRQLAEEDRYVEAVHEYHRAIAALDTAGLPEDRVVARIECFLALVETEDSQAAEQMYDEMHLALETYEMQLSEFEEHTFPLLLQLAHGDTSGVLEALQEYTDAQVDDIPLEEMVSMLKLGAIVHERDGSPLQAAHLLMAIAEMYESTAKDHGAERFGAFVVEAYWEHARFLARTERQCEFEAEVGFDVSPDGLNEDEWRRFLSSTLVDLEPGADIGDAIRERTLMSLDAAEAWKPDTCTLQTEIGTCRVFTLLRGEQQAEALLEAIRVAPIAEQAGDRVSATALRSIIELLSRDFDGPDFGEGRGLGR